MKQYKINSFQVDRNLGYLIQATTKDTSQEILTYFYGTTQFVLDSLIKKSKASFINKIIVLFYKDTPITFRIQISGSGPAQANPSVTVKVNFPQTIAPYDVAELLTAAVESGLGLTEEQDNIAPFGRPQLKIGRAHV